MPVLVETAQFAQWFADLRNQHDQARILVRLRRLSLGNPGDVAPVGSGVSELRIHSGPGYRVYFKRVGRNRVVLLYGGRKDTQDRDIRRATTIAQTLEGDATWHEDER